MKQNLITLAMFPFGMPVVRLGDGNTQLELSYDSADDIPAGMESLYTEKDGKQVLTGVKGMKTQADIDRLQTALTKERNDHKTVRTQLSSLSTYGTIEEITANLDRIPELEAKQGKGDPADIEKIVTARLAPVQRKLDEALTTISEKDKEIGGYKGEKTKATIAETVRKAAKGLKIRESAIEDAIMFGERVLTIDESGNVVTKENSGVTPFATAEDMLRDILPTRQHWLEDSFGGGSQGGKGGQFSGTDPYSHDGWSITEQMKLMKSDPAKAKKLAERNGVDPLKPTKPAKKS
ncbi:capsid assembly scaffolding protein [Enterobacter phage EC151]|nr:capsid assembly scaffolding protein [Enterobacter phage EC151]